MSGERDQQPATTWEGPYQSDQAPPGGLYRTSVSLDSGTLKWDTSCEQGGAVAITASFVLLKK